MLFSPISSCCKCIPLRTGCLILGWVFWILSLIQLVGLIPLLSSEHDVIKTYGEWAIAANILFQLPDIMLLIGVYTRKAGFLMPYLILAGIGLVFCVCALILVLIIGLKVLFVGDLMTADGIFALMSMILYWILIALLTWFFFHCYRVVETYYHQLRYKEGEKRVNAAIENSCFDEMV